MDKKTRKKVIRLYDAFYKLFAGRDAVSAAGEIMQLLRSLRGIVSVDLGHYDYDDLVTVNDNEACLQRNNDNEAFVFKVKVLNAAFKDLSPWFRDYRVLDTFESLRNCVGLRGSYELFASIKSIRRIQGEVVDSSGYAVVTIVVSSVDALTLLLCNPPEGVDKPQINVHML